MIIIKVIYYIKSNLKIIFTTYSFYACIAFVVILCFCTGIYYDNVTNSEYSIIQSLIKFDSNFKSFDTNFSSINVAIKGSGSWLTMFIPIISAFPYVPFVCDESESKAIRNEIIRSSKFSFYSSKFLTGCISGGLAVMFGYILFTGLVFAMFPNINTYTHEAKEIYIKMFSNTYPFVVNHGLMSALLMKYIEMFIYGTMAAVPAIFLTCISKNKYVVMCIPFFLKYAVSQTCIKLYAKANSDFENINEYIPRITNIISPDSVLTIFESHDKAYIFIYNICLVIIAYMLYLLVYSRRLDCGE